MKEFKYDVTIVIPVYNTEKYLKKCINSVLKQSNKKIEVIAVNDGSTDNSLEILKLFDKKYDNVKIIDKKNEGVSVARNEGIKRAQGKYIMLLDSDDTLSRNTVKHLVKFFDQNYNEIDIVTYPIILNRNGILRKSRRYRRYDKGTGIYDVEEYIYLNQSNVNIIIKNEFENNVLYKEKMKLSEDQNFDTEIIMKKKKIGYVEEAKYIYRKHEKSVSSTRNNPYYCFDDIMSYNEMLLEKYSNDGVIPKYVQSLVIHTFGWRLLESKLIPYHFSGQELEKAKERIKNIIKKIDIQVIMKMPDTNLYHKLFFLKFAGYNFEIKYGKVNSVYCNNILIHKFNKITGTISRLKLDEGKVNIVGAIFPFGYFSKDIKLYLKLYYNDQTTEEKEIETYISNESCYLTKMKVMDAIGFDLKLDINNLSKFTIYAKEDNINLDIKFNLSRVFYNYFILNKFNVIYSTKKDVFRVRKANIVNNLKSTIKNYKHIKIYAYSAICLKILSKLTLHRNIWIYQDSGDILDNGYYQFKHDFKKDKTKRFYVYNQPKKAIKEKFTKEERKYLVKYRSLKHKILFLNSDYIITSYAETKTYMPFRINKKAYCYITHYKLVYLQHGVLLAKLLNLYSKEYSKIDKFVISTNFEKENLIKNYHYNESDLIEAGMPRYDFQDLYKVPQNKIIYCPSWRANLIGYHNNKGKRDINEKEFLNSIYYCEINKFLNSKELEEILTKNNLTLDVKLHPIFKPYQNYFKINNKNINIISGEVRLEDYKLFITDFSSYQFDFARLNRPILYYVPDMDPFKAGLHSFRELNLEYKDAFGPLTLNYNDCIENIEKVIKNEFRSEKIYQDRMEGLFIFKDKEQRKRIYEKLKEIAAN